jgi:signal transduction histidine kinase
MKLFASLSFRLTLVYLALFAGSVLLLGGLFYWSQITVPLRAAREQVEQEMQALADLYATRGADALAEKLVARARDTAGRMPFHAFIAADGVLRTANLTSWPMQRRAGWLRLEADFYTDGGEVDHEPMTLDHQFDDGARLLLGRDIEDVDELEEDLLAAVSGLLVGTLLLGVLGGVLMSRAIGRRISVVTDTARQVMQGDMSGRIPLRGSGDDFDRLNATLNEMLARNEALLESVRRVSDNVAHELRTPLARLRASLEELRTARSAGEGEAVDDAIAEAGALEKTFDAVLRIARLESGRHGAVPSPVDLSALLADAAELYAPGAEDRQQSLTLAIAPGLVTRADRDLLFQSFCNLLDNAIKYTPHGGRILLAASRFGARIEVTVTDNGPGIAESQRAHVTERFFRIPATSQAPGAGLGLSLVAAVAQLHDATLVFEDAGPGLTVRWSMPAR